MKVFLKLPTGSISINLPGGRERKQKLQLFTNQQLYHLRKEAAFELKNNSLSWLPASKGLGLHSGEGSSATQLALCVGTSLFLLKVRISFLSLKPLKETLG